MDALEALGARADAADRDDIGAGQGGAQGQPGAAPHANVAEEIAFLLGTLSKLAAPVLPSVSALYTPEACAAIGAELEPVCLKRGWLHGAAMAEWGPEVRALACVVPLAIATVAAARADIEKLKAAKAGQGEQPAADAGSSNAPAAKPGPAKTKAVED